MNDLLTAPEVADQLGLDARTVRDQIRAGKLPARKVGRDWLVAQADVDEYRATRLGRPGRRKAEAAAVSARNVPAGT